MLGCNVVSIDLEYFRNLLWRCKASDPDEKIATELWRQKRVLEVVGDIDEARCEQIARLIEFDHGGKFRVEYQRENYGCRLVLLDLVAMAEYNIARAIRSGMNPQRAKEMFGI